MAQPYKGLRRRATLRLPLPVYEEAARHAAARRWPYSEFLAWCVEEQLKALRRREGARLGGKIHVAFSPPLDRDPVSGRFVPGAVSEGAE